MQLTFLYYFLLITSTLAIPKSRKPVKAIKLPLKRFGVSKRPNVSPSLRLEFLHGRVARTAKKYGKRPPPKVVKVLDSIPPPSSSLSSTSTTMRKVRSKTWTRSRSITAFSKASNIANSGTRLQARANGEAQMGAGTNDYYYFATVSVGTPPVDFQVQLDTGSSDMILMAAPCTANCQLGAPLYQPSNSNSSSASRIPFSIGYVGGSASGVLVNDIVSFGGFNLSQTFAAITASNGIYRAESGVTGIFGLAFKSISASGANPFLQSLSDSNSLDQPLFGMAFARQKSNDTVTPGGFISLGDVDTDLFSGNITYTNTSAATYWQIPLDNVSIGNTTLAISSKNAKIDSGSSLIYLPRNAVATFYSQIPGSSDIGGGIWSYPCNSIINASFTFGGISWPVNRRDFNLGAADTDGNCAGGVAWFDDSSYIFGDVFLKNVYSVFRFSPPSIGFATLAGQNFLQQGFLPNSTISTSVSSTSTDPMTLTPSSTPSLISTQSHNGTISTSLSSTSISSTFISSTSTTSVTHIPSSTPSLISTQSSNSTISTSVSSTSISSTSNATMTLTPSSTPSLISTQGTMPSSSGSSSSTIILSTQSSIVPTQATSLPASSRPSTSVSSKSASANTSTSVVSKSVYTSNSSILATTALPLFKILVVNNSTGAILGYVTKSENTFGALAYNNSSNNSLLIRFPQVLRPLTPINLVSTVAIKSGFSRFNLGISAARYGTTFARNSSSYGWLTQTNLGVVSKFFSLPSDFLKAQSKVWIVSPKTLNGRYPLSINFVDSSNSPVQNSYFFRQASSQNAIGFSSAAVGLVPTFDNHVLLFLVPA